ncbi:MAG: hypothetical protein KY397_05905, partial [Gemmatimonadetes bacterium]|nr:hypothetical protein [Gemmatimonadota bacterium]
MGAADPVERWRRARDDPSRAVLEGFHPVKHALRFGAEILEAVSPDPAALLELARSLAPDLAEELAERVEPVEREVFERLAPRPPETGVAAIARRPDVEPERILDDPSPAPAILLERPRRMGNVGAVIRVAAAAGAAGVLTTGRHDPWNPAAVRGAAGLHWAVPVARIDGLPASDRPVVALDPRGDPLDPASLPSRALLAFGSERHGLGEEEATAAPRQGDPQAPVELHPPAGVEQLRHLTLEVRARRPAPKPQAC